MSILRVDSIRDRAGTGAPDFPNGLTVTGDVSIGGILTYEDVTNIDSVGIVTARAGFVADGFKIEEGYIDTSTSLSGAVNINFDSGQIHRFSAATGGNYYPNFRLNSSNSPTLSSKMGVGDVTSATLFIASSSHYIASPSSIQIDGSSSNIDVDWVGGNAPSAANGSGFDIYAFTIIKTASTPAYHVIVNTGACA